MNYAFMYPSIVNCRNIEIVDIYYSTSFKTTFPPSSQTTVKLLHPAAGIFICLSPVK